MRGQPLGGCSASRAAEPVPVDVFQGVHHPAARRPTPPAGLGAESVDSQQIRGSGAPRRGMHDLVPVAGRRQERPVAHWRHVVLVPPDSWTFPS